MQSNATAVAGAGRHVPETASQDDVLPHGAAGLSEGSQHVFGRVAICTPTFKRPRNLTELLLSVQELDATGIDLCMIVVDNDHAQSARAVIVEAMAGSSIPVTYDCVEEQSLPLVRNRLVELANEIQADWIWFLDDDQFVEPDSLKLMLRTAAEFQADCVIARVPHTFEGSNSPWAKWSGIFDEVRRPTGKPTRAFGTNGALLRRAAVAEIPDPFDVRLRLTGGSDGLFFARFRAHGFRAVGCDEAVLWDRVHPSRNNAQWMTQRAVRMGLTKGFLVREVNPSALGTAKWLALGGGYMTLNALAAAAMYPFGPARYFRYWIKAARGYGIVVGTLFPDRFLATKEYVTVHGQ